MRKEAIYRPMPGVEIELPVADTCATRCQLGPVVAPVLPKHLSCGRGLWSLRGAGRRFSRALPITACCLSEKPRTHGPWPGRQRA
jgi:hypothetical protein